MPRNFVRLTATPWNSSGPSCQTLTSIGRTSLWTSCSVKNFKNEDINKAFIKNDPFFYLHRVLPLLQLHSHGHSDQGSANCEEFGKWRWNRLVTNCEFLISLRNSLRIFFSNFGVILMSNSNYTNFNLGRISPRTECMAFVYGWLVETDYELLEKFRDNSFTVQVAEGHGFKCCGEMGVA